MALWFSSTSSAQVSASRLKRRRTDAARDRLLAGAEQHFGVVDDEDRVPQSGRLDEAARANACDRGSRDGLEEGQLVYVSDVSAACIAPPFALASACRRQRTDERPRRTPGHRPTSG